MTMSKMIQLDCIEDVVKDSEIISYTGNKRAFEYGLSDKGIKTKLLKNAKREPFEVVRNSSSCNLVFSVGAWNYVGLPSVNYWDQVKGDQTCKIGGTTIRVATVKFGTEANGKHVDTQIIFFVDRYKVVCHFYNATQLILVNGVGYAKLVDEFLQPYFKAKVETNLKNIEAYNQHALETLGVKQVKRSSVKYKGGSTFPCSRCDFAAKTLKALGKHKTSEHSISVLGTSSSTSLALPRHSTRNNSVMEVPALMHDNLTIENVSFDEKNTNENPALKYTCIDCKYKTKVKSHMDEHVKTSHGSDEVKEGNII